MSVISCKALSKRYDDVLALNGVDLNVEKGEFFGLLGPNGAGKTTLLRILTGQIRATEGTAEVLGLDVEKEILSVKRKIGIVPEQESPPSFLTPREVLEMVVAITSSNYRNGGFNLPEAILRDHILPAIIRR